MVAEDSGKQEAVYVVGDGVRVGRRLYSLPRIEGLIRIAARNRALLPMVTRSLIRDR